jgi:hypothetical protein
VLTRAEVEAIWAEGAADVAVHIAWELGILLKNPPVPFLREMMGRVMDVPEPDETAVTGLYRTRVGKALAGVLRRASAPELLDPRHPIYRRDLESLALALAVRWPYRPKKGAPPADQGRLRAAAAERGLPVKQAKLEFLRSGVATALAEHGTATDIVVWRTPRKAVRPLYDLSPREYLRWFVTRVESVATAELWGSSETRHRDVIGAAGPLADEDVEDAAAGTVPAVAAEADRRLLLGDERIDQLYAVARDDTDRALIDAVAEYGTTAAAARELGMNKEKAKTRVRRLQERVQQLRKRTT